ncbi:cell division cycle and apoptosis regulator protein 1 [Trichoplusia ni]|uniref:Cell division cycle and apoptosis regulator protein 1 n=1 Tax=Trichoplusia ni TaxID=7111 RepID=A0A7E5W4N0_TRINI|nr:cell division cycle and apoptosis regulator protein 1 [Trichoplusia ni]
MADSTVMEVSKMKVVDLRKELKTRGLSYTGDKAELVARLQAAMSQDEHGDINLDSDEIDSDGVLEDEDEDKSQADALDAVDPLTEEMALSEQPPLVKPPTEIKQTRTLKRRITSTDISKDKTDDSKTADSKEIAAKKIVLNRAIISAPSKTSEEKEDAAPSENNTTASNKIKITADLDTKTRLEMRAKRFGLPVKVSEGDRKEARKQRFGQAAAAKSSTAISTDTGTLTENMEKLKKRAERFGQSVSKIMSDIENKERLEKRKAKFGASA